MALQEFEADYKQMLNEAYPWFKDLGREKTEDLLNIIYKPEITPSPLFNYECVVHKEPFGFKFQLKSGCSEPKERIDPQQPFELNLNPPPGTFEEFATRAQKTMVDKIHSKFEQTVVDKIHSFFEQRARSKAKEGIAKAKSVPKDRKDSSDANELEDEGESDSKNESPAEIIGKREAAERDLFRSLVSGETRKDLEPFTRPNFLYYEVPHWQQYLRFLEIRYGPEKTPVEKKHAEETSKKQESSNLDTIGEAYTIGGRPTAPVQRCFFLKLEGA